jgi:hypothetical protein
MYQVGLGWASLVGESVGQPGVHLHDRQIPERAIGCRPGKPVEESRGLSLQTGDRLGC